MNHSNGYSMFMDLDKPLLKDPLERIEAAMEWEAISEMYSQRDEHRKRTGFVKDIHEERGFSLNPITGRYRDAPGFNPPRRVEKRDYEGIPIEVKGIILDNIEGFRNRTLTRTVSRSHAYLTRSLDDILDEVINDVLKEINRPDVPERDISSGRTYGKRVRRTLKEWMNSILYTVSKRVLEKLSIPLKVTLPKSTRFKIGYVEVLPMNPPLGIYENGLLFIWHMEFGTNTLGIYYQYDESYESDVTVYARNLWDHYPLVMRIIRRASESIPDIAFIRAERVEEEYKMFKEKRSSGD